MGLGSHRLQICLRKHPQQDKNHRRSLSQRYVEPCQSRHDLEKIRRRYGQHDWKFLATKARTSSLCGSSSRNSEQSDRNRLIRRIVEGKPFDCKEGASEVHQGGSCRVWINRIGAFARTQISEDPGGTSWNRVQGRPKDSEDFFPIYFLLSNQHLHMIVVTQDYTYHHYWDK